MSGTTSSSLHGYHVIAAHRSAALGVRVMPSYNKKHGAGIQLRVRGAGMTHEIYDGLSEGVRAQIGQIDIPKSGGLSAMNVFRAFGWQKIAYERVSYETGIGFVFAAMDEMDARAFIENVGIRQVAQILDIQLSNCARTAVPTYGNPADLAELLKDAWTYTLKDAGVEADVNGKMDVMDFFSDTAKHGELGEEAEDQSGGAAGKGHSWGIGSYFTISSEIADGDYDPSKVYEVVNFEGWEDGPILVIGKLVSETGDKTIKLPPEVLTATNEDGVPLEHCKQPEPQHADETLYTVGEKFTINPAHPTSYDYDDVFEVTDSYYGKDGLAYVVGVRADGSTVTLPNIYAVSAADQAKG